MPDAPPEDLALRHLLARGIGRALAQRGYASLTEVSLANGRRADVMALGRAGELGIVEVKSSVQDCRSDVKWPEYREFCDRFYFAVPENFPREAIPEDCGLVVADGFGAAVLREAPVLALPAARRKAVTLRFALVRSKRLRPLLDPASDEPTPL